MARKYTKDEIDKFHDYDFWLTDKTIYIGSQSYDENFDETGVDHLMAERVIKNLHILDSSVSDKGITIKMNNPGGSVTHGLAIYDGIKTCQNRITCIAYGQVSSMGSLIFQAADERYMTQNCRMMIHSGQVSLSGETNNVYANVDENKLLDKQVNEIYLKRIKEKKREFSMREFEKKIIKDWYLSPEEAIEFGLNDGVWIPWDK